MTLEILFLNSEPFGLSPYTWAMLIFT